MSQVCVGIYLHSEPIRLAATMQSLRAHTQVEVELVLLPDGSDAATRVALANNAELPQLATVDACGIAACFNRLAVHSQAATLVLLESGCLVAPGWLEHLLAALQADPRNGLVGPSTNFVWNEQCAFPGTGGSAADLLRTAQEAQQRFGAQTRTLEPLYSLADFCYAVRREVIEDVGAADESYGLGPCWEMDYNIRAARAGWRGVWAGGSYVWRAPFTARRRMEESLRFETSKRLYQDKFCGARLRSEKSDYRSHCRGDECRNFAPADLIQIHRPLPDPEPIAEAVPKLPLADLTEGNRQPAIQFVQSDQPLVSCIMPTADRRSYVPQAIRIFQRQDYPNLELVIVDDGNDSIADCVPHDSRIRYFRLERKMTIGAKRNFACEQAQGEMIVHWDDDDWYPTWRVRAQVNALIHESAAICGTSRLYYCDPGANRAWLYSCNTFKPSWVAGNTLAYRHSFWEGHKFADLQVGEDSRFVWNAAGNRISDLNDPGLCVATVHAGNTSAKQTNGSYWTSYSPEKLQELLGDDRYFYRVAQPCAQESEWPLVSCIMPTRNRRAFVHLAVQSFCRQDYPNRELIVVDDGDDPVKDLVESRPGVHYIRLANRASIGAKRNLACAKARGRIIAHWDDDDWYSTDRLRYQVIPILSHQAEITGLENAFTMQLPEGRLWAMRPELHRKMFVGDVHGGTLVFDRGLLDQGISYPDINLAEDAWLIQRAAGAGKRLMKLANPGVFVYVRHGRNAWRFNSQHTLGSEGWAPISKPSLFPFGQLSAYQIAAT